jgi:hypothetical protein
MDRTAVVYRSYYIPKVIICPATFAGGSVFCKLGGLRRWTWTLFMVFTKRLREGIRRGEITCSVRIWMSPRVRMGARYRMEEGEIEVDSIEPIGFPDITPELARVGIPGRSGFAEGGETWPRREYLFDPVSLCATAREANGAAEVWLELGSWMGPARSEEFPQGLKPPLFRGVFGTAEAVPSQKAIMLGLPKSNHAVPSQNHLGDTSKTSKGFCVSVI